MVKHHSYAANPADWITQIEHLRGREDAALLQTFIHFYQDEHLQAGLTKAIDIADILLSLDLDTESLAAALAYPAIQQQALATDTITDLVGESGHKLLQDVMQMQSLSALKELNTQHSSAPHIEKLRKMLLAMVTDVRAVLIILAERLWQLRKAKTTPVKEQLVLAKETQDVYAPLANRLGIWQLKWELEDLCLRYLQPEVYTRIAKWLASRREEREAYIQMMMNLVTDLLRDAGLNQFQVTGRVKHIDSIHRKILRKNVAIEEIYDISAIRVLVPDIEACYRVLAILQAHWQQVPKEFDDYISQPKPNGYRSIHTVLIGPQDRFIEVQIRTEQMHHESELGVAAHWRYKERASHSSDYEGKIALLRQIMAWQREVTNPKQTDNPPAMDKIPALSTTDLFADRVYVFTPMGEIVDLPKGSTPLDFAYFIHSEVGHRCRGAKIDGKMVSLKHQLQTGERVEILTAKHANPSRDWLNPQLGYLKTSRARARAQHWFRMQDHAQNVSDGRDLLEKEFKRLGIVEKFDLHAIAQKLHYKHTEDMLGALGAGDLKIATFVNHIRPLLTHHSEQIHPGANQTTSPPPIPHEVQGLKEIHISGISNLMTAIAQCCKPLPGDDVIGYITRNRAVTIHKRDCGNILNPQKVDVARLIEVNWGGNKAKNYPVPLLIRAFDRAGLLRDVTALLANEKINVLGLSTERFVSQEGYASIYLTLEVGNAEQLKKALTLLKGIPNIVDIKRR